ncbi:MAG: RNA polymerase sigma factor [Myxococcales bacterium]|nr:RNA polymerase sigma factor [Myxococcales bacterium]MCB9750946.1 RNA polymerase sigma factor [Myxococcales bacterium]
MKRNTESDAAGERRSIHALMRDYLCGDHHAFASLLARINPRLVRVARSFTHDLSTAEDIVQQALMKCHARRSSFDRTRAQSDAMVVAWFTTIVRNTARDHARAERALRRCGRTMRGRYVDLELPDPASELEAHCIELESDGLRKQRLRRALAKLPPGQRAVIKLHKLRGLPFDEVARRLESRASALRARAHRAYRALARIMLAEEPAKTAALTRADR